MFVCQPFDKLSTLVRDITVVSKLVILPSCEGIQAWLWKTIKNNAREKWSLWFKGATNKESKTTRAR
jgi:hypothetical protein